MAGAILVVNSGSSSIKVAVFDGEGRGVVDGSVSEIGGASARLKIAGAARVTDMPDHKAALSALLAALAECGYGVETIAGVGHRVVHGGAHLRAPVRVDAGVIREIAACIPLAPLHNPHNLAAIQALATVAPDLPQVACFDTAFHATNPQVAIRYALPPEAEALGIRRYGFHGISYQGLVHNLPAVSGAPMPRRLLACHLGNGASLCALREGQSVATTMGYSPLEGLTMGTRTGGIDGNAVLRLVEEFGAERAGRLLNNQSGLLGLSGFSSDMRALQEADTSEAAFALKHFAYWAMRHAGSMIAAMGGCDAIAFTGGIGENSASMRAAILSGLDWLGVRLDDKANKRNATRLHDTGAQIAVWIVPAKEEATIAGQARSLLAAASN